MKYQGIIFDLDGVICHTDHYHYLAWKKIADTLKITFNEKINNRLRGVSRVESFSIILERYQGPELSREQKEMYTDQKNKLYQQLLQEMTEKDLSAEVSKTLHTLRALGYKLAIGSSSRNARFILAQIGLSDYFDAVCDGNDITHSKPHPEVFVKAAGKLQLPPEQCLVVEDSVAGLESALAGGMDCAAVGDAAKSKIATYILHSFSALPEIVNRV